MRIKYTQNGLWLEKIEEKIRIGLSEKGQDDVGEVMFVELPKFDEQLQAGDTILGVEGAKAVTEFTSPISGDIVQVHKELEDDFELLNSKNLEDNWIVELSNVTGFDAFELSDDPWFGLSKPKMDEE